MQHHLFRLEARGLNKEEIKTREPGLYSLPVYRIKMTRPEKKEPIVEATNYPRQKSKACARTVTGTKGYRSTGTSGTRIMRAHRHYFGGVDEDKRNAVNQSSIQSHR